MAEHGHTTETKSSSPAGTSHKGAENLLVKLVMGAVDIGVEEVKPAMIETSQKIAPAAATAMGLHVEEGGGDSHHAS